LSCINIFKSIESERINKTTAKVEKDVRFYISTLDSAEQIAKAVRSHWGIENSLHWVLDVAFREDTSTKRAENAVQIMR
jgi:predicted transposase YbfD/YdcC